MRFADEVPAKPMSLAGWSTLIGALTLISLLLAVGPGLFRQVLLLWLRFAAETLLAVWRAL